MWYLWKFLIIMKIHYYMRLLLKYGSRSLWNIKSKFSVYCWWKCSKRFPRKLVTETISGNDGYPLYRRRSTDDNGRSAIVKVNQLDIEVDNRRVVPLSPLLPNTFKAHINVEYCHSVKSIKYFCKYVTKGSGIVVFGVAAETSNDEITHFQMGRYGSSNVAIWRIFFISNTWKTPHCSSPGRTSRKWS